MLRKCHETLEHYKIEYSEKIRISNTLLKMFNACVIWVILVTELIFLSGEIVASLTLKLK